MVNLWPALSNNLALHDGAEEVTWLGDELDDMRQDNLEGFRVAVHLLLRVVQLLLGLVHSLLGDGKIKVEIHYFP